MCETACLEKGTTKCEGEEESQGEDKNPDQFIKTL